MLVCDTVSPSIGGQAELQNFPVNSQAEQEVSDGVDQEEAAMDQE